MAIIGYVRPSLTDQGDYSVQEAALKAAGAEIIRIEKRPGLSVQDCKELRTIFEFIRPDDMLMVTRIERLASSVSDLWNIVREVKTRGASLKVIEQPNEAAIDKDFFKALEVFAEFEANLRLERQEEVVFQFLDLLIKREGGPLTTPCWTIQGRGRDQGGYVRIRFNGKTASAHRIVYELVFGAFDPGLVIRHRCDRPDCVNPDHLDIGTAADNVADRHERRRDLWRRCQLDGIANAKVRGIYKGRQPSIDRAAVRGLKAEGVGPTEIAEALGIGRASVYRILEEDNSKGADNINSGSPATV